MFLSRVLNDPFREENVSLGRSWLVNVVGASNSFMLIIMLTHTYSSQRDAFFFCYYRGLPGLRTTKWGWASLENPLQRNLSPFKIPLPQFDALSEAQRRTRFHPTKKCAHVRVTRVHPMPITSVA